MVSKSTSGSSRNPIVVRCVMNMVNKYREREFVIDNLPVRIHFTIEMIWWTGLVPRELESPFPGSLMSTFLVGVPMVVLSDLG